MASAGITIQVSGLGKEQVAALRKQAKTLGLSTETYVKRLIEDGLTLEHRARSKSFDELAAPLRSEFKRSGMSGEELDRLVDAARTRQQQRSRRKKS